MNHFVHFLLRRYQTLDPRLCHLFATPNRELLQTFDSFHPVSQSELMQLMSSMKSSSPLDALSTDILTVFKKSLSTGVVPSVFKSAIVQPLLKKANLDSNNFNNSHPICKLPFLAKVLEKVVYSQLLSFLNEHSLFQKFQSSFRRHHSTETALLKVVNDIRMNSDTGYCTVLVLLDFSAVFDTVDHDILIARLENWVGVTGTSLILKPGCQNRSDGFWSHLSFPWFTV